jgi:chaperonin GroES
MNHRPLFNNIIVKPIIVEEQRSFGGIILTNAPVDKTRCKVIAIGPGKTLDNGTVIPVPFAVGDTVILSDELGTVFIHEREEYYIADASKVVAVVE